VGPGGGCPRARRGCWGAVHRGKSGGVDGPICSPGIEDPTPKDETRTRARAPRRARALGPGALGPEGLGPWALGPLALGAWARARGVPTAPLPGARGPASPPRGTGLWRQGRARATPHPCQPPRGSGKGSRGQLARSPGSPPRLASPRAARPVPRAPARGPGSPPRAPGGWGGRPRGAGQPAPRPRGTVLGRAGEARQGRAPGGCG
jgi:translation initiation factor IF-2